MPACLPKHHREGSGREQELEPPLELDDVRGFHMLLQCAKPDGVALVLPQHVEELGRYALPRLRRYLTR